MDIYAILGVMKSSSISTKRARFLRIGEKRTNKILQMIRLLSNCANKSAYEYDDADIKKIFVAIDEELRIARTRFSTRDKSKFSLE